MSTWIIWLILAIALIIIELLSGLIATFCVAVGCLVGMALDLAGANLVWQVVGACVATGVTFGTIAPALKRLRNRPSKSREYASNMDALIGRTGRVAETIPAKRTGMGRVKIDGDNWLALTDSDRDFAPGELAKVTAYDSLILTVTHADRESLS